MMVRKKFLHSLNGLLPNLEHNTNWKRYVLYLHNICAICAMYIYFILSRQALQEVMTSENLPPPPTHLLEISGELEVCTHV